MGFHGRCQLTDIKTYIRSGLVCNPIKLSYNLSILGWFWISTWIVFVCLAVSWILNRVDTTNIINIIKLIKLYFSVLWTDVNTYIFELLNWFSTNFKFITQLKYYCLLNSLLLAQRKSSAWDWNRPHKWWSWYQKNTL